MFLLFKYKEDKLLVEIWAMFSMYQEGGGKNTLFQVPHCPFCVLSISVIMEQLENNPIFKKSRTISCSSMGYKYNFPVWLLDCGNLLRLN